MVTLITMVKTTTEAVVSVVTTSTSARMTTETLSNVFVSLQIYSSLHSRSTMDLPWDEHFIGWSSPFYKQKWSHIEVRILLTAIRFEKKILTAYMIFHCP